MMRKLLDSAKKGRSEAALRRAMEDLGLQGQVSLRSLDDRTTATLLLTGPDPEQSDSELEAALAERSGLDRVTLVRTSHGKASNPAPQPAPKPAPSGGHGDPLSLGSRPQTRPDPTRPEGVKAVIAVASGKGGVGKSTVAANLALELAGQGKRVGLLDLDIHGPSLPVLFPHDEKLRGENGQVIPAEQHGLKLVSLGYMVDERQAVAWRGPMVMNAARQLIDDVRWGDLDVLIIDTPPGTGDAHLTMIQRLKLDAAVLVATPSPLATADVRRGAALFQKANVPVAGIVLNMIGGPFGDDLEPALLDELDLDVLDSLPVTLETAQVPLKERASPLLSGTISHLSNTVLALAGDRSA